MVGGIDDPLHERYPLRADDVEVEQREYVAAPLGTQAGAYGVIFEQPNRANPVADIFGKKTIERGSNDLFVGRYA